MNQQAMAMDLVQTAQTQQKKPEDKAHKQALKVADEYEAMEEEEMMRRAIEESQKIDTQDSKLAYEEEEMIAQAIEMSRREEEARIQRVDQIEKEQMQVAEKLKEKDHTKVEVTVAQIKAKTLEQEKEEQIKKLKQVQQ